MCISFFGIDCHPDIKFFLLFNRDENLSRPTLPLKIYGDCLMFSLDEISGGTFFCLNIKNGNFSCILNYPLIENPYSETVKFKRGALPIEFCQEESHELFFKKLSENLKEYNGFNLISGNFVTKKIYYFTNNSELNEFNYTMPIELSCSRIYGLENTWIFNEIFATKHGINKLKSLLEITTTIDKDDILDKFYNIMSDTTTDPDVSIDKNDKDFFNDFCIFKKSFNIYNNDINYFEFGTRQTICFYVDIDNNIFLREYFSIIENNSQTNKFIDTEKDEITNYTFKIK
jgi:uncharacterized protein with NRDE domain